MLKRGKESKMEKMYILTRKDLRKSYQAVQAGHALAEFMIKHPEEKKKWNNSYLIYLGVKDEDELNYWEQKLKNNDINHASFKEPDIGNQKTSLACYCKGDHFKQLPLL